MLAIGLSGCATDVLVASKPARQQTGKLGLRTEATVDWRKLTHVVQSEPEAMRKGVAAGADQLMSFTLVNLS